MLIIFQVTALGVCEQDTEQIKKAVLLSFGAMYLLNIKCHEHPSIAVTSTCSYACGQNTEATGKSISENAHRAGRCIKVAPY